jgi:hypothetical protein
VHVCMCMCMCMCMFDMRAIPIVIKGCRHL